MTMFFAAILPLHAEAPELRNVRPNRWQKVTRLAATEKIPAAFITQYASPLQTGFPVSPAKFPKIPPVLCHSQIYLLA
jgi:hypothetical protein